MATLILDNEGDTFDRYSVIIDGEVIGMSENPKSPSGYNQYCGDMEYLGWESIDAFVTDMENEGQVLVELDTLNDDVKNAIAEHERVICLSEVN